MSALNKQPAFWSRFFGIFKSPAGRTNTVAAHLQSISPETAARLMGPGSVPPKLNTSRLVAVGAVVQPAKLIVPSTSTLPWPLLRTTGVFQDLHAQTDRALALSTIDLVAQLSDELSTLEDDYEAVPVAQPRNLAGQLAVVARLNQPTARTFGKTTAKAAAGKRAAKPAFVQKRASGKANAASAKPAHDIAAKPQALIIDLAAVKKLRRIEKARRAA